MMGVCRKLAAAYFAAGVAILAVGAVGVYEGSPLAAAHSPVLSLATLTAALSIGTPLLAGLIITVGLLNIRRLRTGAARLLQASPDTISTAGDEVDQLARAFEGLIQSNVLLRARQSDHERQSDAQHYAENIFNAMFDVLIMVDPAELCVAQVNRAACELLEYSDLELIGRPVQTLFYQEPYALCPPIEVRLRNSETRDSEMTYCTKSGRCITALVSASTMCDPSGRPIAIITVGKDITSRKQIENNLIEARHAAESAHRATSKVLSNLSQEIRVPVSAILGHIDFLSVVEFSEPDRRRLEALRRHGQHLLQMINSTAQENKLPAQGTSSNTPTAFAPQTEGLIRLCQEAQFVDDQAEPQHPDSVIARH